MVFALCIIVVSANVCFAYVVIVLITCTFKWNN